MRILCPKHQENTPSCYVYPDGKFHCFGCGANGYAKDLGIDLAGIEVKKAEDLNKSIAYINSLETRVIRGLNLPVDDKYYYVLWPNHEYYKKRRIGDFTHARYVSPRGHSKPLLVCVNAKNKTLFIVEGEINAMSLSQTLGSICDIISPGPCVNFTLKDIRQVAMQLPNYRDIVIVVDKDAPGIGAAIKLKAELSRINPRVSILPLEEDFNDLLVKYGKEAVKKRVSPYLEVSQ